MLKCSGKINGKHRQGRNEMHEAYMRVHHMATPMGEFLIINCPHCGEEIELTAKLLADNDMIVLRYGEKEECDETGDCTKKT